jgi:uncharacterized BrkB/YihY/UPF0761 family membrane protein
MTSTRPQTPPRTWDFLLTGFLVFVELLLVVVFVLSALTFGTLNSGASISSTTRVQLGQQICTFVPPVIAVATIPWAIIRVARRKIGFHLALIGALLMTAAFFVGSTLMQSGIPA